jgi:hypothetical protein
MFSKYADIFVREKFGNAYNSTLSSKVDYPDRSCRSGNWFYGGAVPLAFGACDPRSV